MRRFHAVVWAGLTVLTLAQCAHSGRKDDEARALSNEIAEIMVAHHAIDAAVPLVQRGLADNPNDPRMHTLMGILLRDRGLFEEARRELRTAYAMQPDDLDTVVATGVLLDMMGEGATAQVWHERAITMNPQRADLYNNLGFSHYLRHQDEQAVAAYHLGLERDPTAHRMFNNLGFALARLGRYQEAMGSFEHAGGKGGALANMGVAYEMAGDLQAAKGFYEQALVVDKSLKSARDNLQSVLARLQTAEEKP